MTTDVRMLSPGKVEGPHSKKGWAGNPDHLTWNPTTPQVWLWEFWVPPSSFEGRSRGTPNLGPRQQKQWWRLARCFSNFNQLRIDPLFVESLAASVSPEFQDGRSQGLPSILFGFWFFCFQETWAGDWNADVPCATRKDTLWTLPPAPGLYHRLLCWKVPEPSTCSLFVKNERTTSFHVSESWSSDYRT